MRCSPTAMALAIVLAIGAGLTIADSPADARAVGGQYIVRFADKAVSGPSTSARSRVRVGDIASGWRVDKPQLTRRIRSVRAMGIKPKHVFRHGIAGFSARLTAAQVTRLRADPSVAAVEIDAPVSVEGERVEGSVVSVASVSPQQVPTGVRRIYADEQPLAHIGSGADTDVDIAVIDTGIEAHPDLRIGGGVNCTGVDSTNYGDVYGHGTHVAGIIGARDNGVGVVGVVPGARMWAIKSLDDDGHGSTSTVLCGLDWMIGQQQSAGGPRFLAANMSIAGPLVYPNRPCGRGTGDTYHVFICAALDSGIVIAAAAANDHRVVNLRPAIYDEPITVGAIADFDGEPGGKGLQSDICPWYSPDTDDTYANFSDWGAAVDILAPGKCILSTFTKGRYAWMSGTSMATPYVAGAVALYRMRYPNAQPQQVKQALVSAGTRDWRTGTSPDGRAYRLLQVRTLTVPPTFLVSTGAGGLLGGADTSHGIQVTLSRKDGHYRPIQVRAASDPDGIGYTTLAIGEGNHSGTLRLLGTDALASGPLDVTVTASDGELEATTTVRVNIDADDPVVTVTSPAPGATTVQRGHTVRIAAHGSDALSGIASRTLTRRRAAPSGLMSCDGVTFATDGDPVTVTGSGPYSRSGPLDGVCYQWALTTTDKAGNSAVDRSGAVWIDGSAPLASTASAEGEAVVRGSTIWFRGGSEGDFTLTATGRDPQSGIGALSVSGIAGASWSAGPKQPTIANPGARTATTMRAFHFGSSSAASTVSLTAVDGVGRTTVTTLQVKPDTAAPGLTITSPVRQTWLGSDQATVHFTAADAGSGIATISARRQRAPLPSKSAGCGDVSWSSDGSAQALSGDRFTATGLERDTCYRWVLRATDRLGHARSRTTAPVAIDPTRPVVEQLRVSVARQPVGATGEIPVFASWVLASRPVGSTTYQVAKTGDGGATWPAVDHSPASATRDTTYISDGRATTLAVRARSSTGAISSWAVGPKVTARLAEEDATSVSHSSGWSRVQLAAASGDYRLESTKHGASVTYDFTGSSIALVAARGETLGLAIVRIDGTQVATVTLTSSNAVNRQIVWNKGLTSGKHTITIVVKDGRVVVDGFVTTQTAEGDAR